MDLHLYRHLWGVNEAWASFFPKVKAAGYHGVESGMPSSDREAEFRRLLAETGLAYVPQIFSGCPQRSVAGHVKSFIEQAERTRSFNPVFINAHSGHDSWSLDQALEFYREIDGFCRTLGIPVVHETHRGRFFNTPRDTSAVLERLPDLRLTADFSHWVNVCERLLDDQLDHVAFVAPFTRHVHARVGYEHGPQVPDPRAPEYQRHLEAHERWWNLVWAAQERAGLAVTTLTPEFGPPGYLHTLPHTNVPVADLGQICDWQAQRQRERFAARARSAAAAAR